MVIRVELSPAELGKRADACRNLAATSNTDERKALWLGRAEYWGQRALEAAESLLESVKSGRKDRGTRSSA